MLVSVKKKKLKELQYVELKGGGTVTASVFRYPPLANSSISAKSRPPLNSKYFP
jgi:hypothetical protein